MVAAGPLSDATSEASGSSGYCVSETDSAESKGHFGGLSAATSQDASTVMGEVLGLVRQRRKFPGDGLLHHHLDTRKIAHTHSHKARRASAPATLGTSDLRNKHQKQHQYNAAVLQQLVTLQQQYNQVAASYEQLRKDAKVRCLRQRIARAKMQASYTKAAQVLSQPSTPPRSPTREQPEHQQQQQQQTPSLPALTLVVKMLLQLASAKASPMVAAQLRQQLLQQVKAATTAARAAGQDFSVAASVYSMLPALRSAVLQACRQQEQAAASTAAAVETALTAAACEVQLCSLTVGGQLQGEQQVAASAAGPEEMCRVDSLAMDIEQLLQAEMASAMSAQL